MRPQESSAPMPFHPRAIAGESALHREPSLASGEKTKASRDTGPRVADSDSLRISAPPAHAHQDTATPRRTWAFGDLARGGGAKALGQLLDLAMGRTPPPGRAPPPLARRGAPRADALSEGVGCSPESRCAAPACGASGIPLCPERGVL